MPKQRQPTVHPFTFFLVHGLEQIFASLTEKGYRDALNSLFWITAFLDREGKTKVQNLIDHLQRCTIDGQKYTIQEFHGLLSQIMDELHDEGYFIAAKFTPPTRTTTLKELKLDVQRAQYAGTG